MTRSFLPRPLKFTRAGAIALAALSLAVAGLQYAPDAQARGGGGHHHHGGGRGGAFIGGVVIGAAIARPYYPSYYYQPYVPPPVYYTPPAAYYPPPVAYSQPGPVTYIEQPQNYVTAPIAATPQLPLEQRAQRLKAMCDRGLFTPQECAARREQILREM